MSTDDTKRAPLVRRKSFAKDAVGKGLPADQFPARVRDGLLIGYRSVGLGVFGTVCRCAGMPLEKLALFANSSQVEQGSFLSQLRQAARLTFAGGWLAPFRVIGPASLTAWFLQYSIMGIAFQSCDTMLSAAMGTPRLPYGADLMDPPGKGVSAEAKAANADSPAAHSTKQAAKALLAPAIAAAFESAVSNRAEVQRFYGLEKFRAVERQISSNAVARACGPAFLPNALRNFVMSSTSFVVAPILFKNYYPQEQKSSQSLFAFALGLNVFFGNVIAITQQAFWGRTLDYCAAGGGRPANYGEVIRSGLRAEGVAAFFTPAKWFTRVLMNAPAQGTLPWVYNEILPMGEASFLGVMQRIYAVARPKQP